MYSTSVSLHRVYRQCRGLERLFSELKHRIPNIQPCYAVSAASSPAVVSFLRERRIPMICHNAREEALVADNSLVIAGRRFGTSNECIVRNVTDIAPRAPPPLWLHTTISHDGIETTREMFEYIWAHKYLVNGIVFNVNNFSNPVGSIPPTIYSYKIALDYLFRNIIHPFESEYGIQTPCIMIDGRNHITQMPHLDELHSYIRECRQEKQPVMRLILGTLIDRNIQYV
jgi:hypothetical protein